MLKEHAKNLTGDRMILIEPSARNAIRLALERTPPTGTICVTGSLYLIGEIRAALNLEHVC